LRKILPVIVLFERFLLKNAMRGQSERKIV